MGLGLLLPAEFLAEPGKRLVFALFIGTAMSTLAIPVIAKVLMELEIIRRDRADHPGRRDDRRHHRLDPAVGGHRPGSGVISLFTAGRSILSVILVLVLASGLAFGTITQALKVEAVLGAFVAGILVGQVKRFDERLRHIFEQVALGVFAPVFFAASGLRADIGALAKPRVLVVGLLVLAIAILGKFVGAYLGARISKLGHWEALSLGAGMNARGAMEIIMATIGFSRGILTAEMYSIILMVAIVTSLMAPPLLRWTLSHVTPSDEEKQRLEHEERRRESFVGNLKRVLVPIPAGSNGQATMAAKLVGLLVQEEDVEVTSLALKDDGGDKEKRPRTPVQDEMEDLRRIARATEGNPAEAILEEAKRGYDLLVLGARGGGANGGGPLFEHFVDDVIQEAPCSLLVMASREHDDPDERFEKLCRGHILVPIAGNDADRYAAEVAFAMASQRDAEVDLVHVVSGPQHALRGPTRRSCTR